MRRFEPVEVQFRRQIIRYFRKWPGDCEKPLGTSDLPQTGAAPEPDCRFADRIRPAERDDEVGIETRIPSDRYLEQIRTMGQRLQ